MNQIRLDKAYNFRDIGGYETNEGLVVKKGLLFRSDELSKLSEADIETIRKLNIKTIIDYRSERERVNNEDKPIPGAKVVYLDPKADVAALASSDNKHLLEQRTDKITAKQAYDMMSSQNREFVLAPSAKASYAQMLQLVLDPANCGIVQHCRGGKDRTGYGIALILLLLGVDQKTVVEDYMLTNVCKHEKNTRSLAEAYEQTHNEDFVLALRYLKEAREEFLLGALDIINNSYGGIEQYAINELNFSRENIQTLKQIYLEEKI
ncbi:tyrosine-protein phosphatase [Dielma fastidiosa]|uniref:tyrosine-protein phosphatase n=1 Tax=Dielma fastidiosa TaxID=1034346 RepID=UPI0023F0CA60|nr:tyrosine-protein phosphatase [Dielma fastidiosa]